MKKILLFAITASLGAACTPASPEPDDDEVKLRPTATILVNDLSQSTTYIDFSIAEWRNSWAYDAQHGGCQLAVVQITESSEQQTPWISSLVKMDTLPHTGTIYRKNAILKANQAKTEVANLAFDNWETLLKEKVFLPKDRSYSDVSGALKLAQQLAIAYKSKNYNVRLLVLSDLLHDPFDDSRLHPVELPKGTEVIIVGGATQISCKELFPNAQAILIPAYKAELFFNP